MLPEYRTYLKRGEEAGARYVLALPRNALTGLTGARVGSTPGSSLEFRDFRDYRPGDDLRRIDWGAYARTDRLTVRIYHEEVAPRLDIVLDGSRSMALPDSAKAEAALGLAAALATAAENAGCASRAWLAADGFRRIAGGNEAPGLWPDVAFEAAGNVAQAFALLPPSWRPRGIRILLSDLLWLGDPLHCLRLLTDGAAHVVVVQVLARADAEPACRGNVTLVDSETGEHLRIFVDASTEERYRRNLSQHRHNWHQACRQCGASLVTVIAEEIAAGWQLDALVAAGVLGGA
jgi:uncharacterized protein (DUF58 family)